MKNRATEEQIVYAKILDLGMKVGLIAITVTFGVYVFGLLGPHISQRTMEDIRFLGMVLSTLKVNRAGDVAYLEITRQMIKETGAELAKAEGFINYARSIGGVRIAIVFKEDLRDPNRVNVSFRSKGDIDVNGIGAYFIVRDGARLVPSASPAFAQLGGTRLA